MSRWVSTLRKRATVILFVLYINNCCRAYCSSSSSHKYNYSHLCSHSYQFFLYSYQTLTLPLWVLLISHAFLLASYSNVVIEIWEALLHFGDNINTTDNKNNKISNISKIFNNYFNLMLMASIVILLACNSLDLWFAVAVYWLHPTRWDFYF